jgi:hypothetical protein
VVGRDQLAAQDDGQRPGRRTADGHGRDPAGRRQQARRLQRALDRLGAITDRLLPVHELVVQACAEYQKAAECFAAAKNCGFEELTRGSGLLLEAEIRGANIKDAVG